MKCCTTLEIGGIKRVGHPKKICWNDVKSDGLSPEAV